MNKSFAGYFRLVFEDSVAAVPDELLAGATGALNIELLTAVAYATKCPSPNCRQRI
jgi:hypothetical protein